MYYAYMHAYLVSQVWSHIGNNSWFAVYFFTVTVAEISVRRKCDALEFKACNK